MRQLLSLLVTSIFLVSLAAAQDAAPQYLYRASLVQAAPGKLIELIDLYKSRTAAEQPLWMRHSQGDRWDLLILTPMGTYADYFRADAVKARQLQEQDTGWESRRKAMVAWEEDVFVFGPPLPALRKAFSAAGFFHVEMFRSLPDERADLLHEREMENAYARAVKQPENFIFVRDQGASWDVFTIGCFRDLKHYAESADVTREQADAAAKGAGFESAAAIGPYLRRFIADHHDTLAVGIR